MDWADEIAKRFDGFTAGRIELLAEIAIALRKAKADGMREAAEIATDYEVDLGNGYAVCTAPWMSNAIARELRARASEIENPTP